MTLFSVLLPMLLSKVIGEDSLNIVIFILPNFVPEKQNQNSALKKINSTIFQKTRFNYKLQNWY